MASSRNQTSDRPQPRLYLLAPAAGDAQAVAENIGVALDMVDIAAVLLRLPEGDERTLINRVKTIVPVAQQSDVALILGGHPGIVARAGADGAHLDGIAAFEDAVGGLKPDRIAGAGGLETRHDAMLAAERGADYVMFGEPDENGERPSFEAIIDRVSWWAEVFQVPCVGYAHTLDEIAPLVEAGADFVAVGDAVFDDPRGVEAAIADAAQRLVLRQAVA